MTAVRPLNGSPRDGDLQAGTDALFYARAVLADLADFDTDTVVLAADVIAASPEADPSERADSAALANRLRKDAE